MVIDAGIPLQGHPNFPTAQSLLGVSQAIEQMKDRQRMAQLAQRMQQYFSTNPDAIDHNTGIVSAKAIGDLYAMDAGAGQRASEQRMKMLGQSADVAAQEQDTAFRKWNEMSKVMKDGMQRAYAKGTAIEGGTDAQRDKVANEDWQEHLNELDKSGMADRLGIDTNKYRQIQVKWDTLPYQMATIEKQQEIRQRDRTQQDENLQTKEAEGTALSAIPDQHPEQQDIQTATKSGAQYRGAPEDSTVKMRGTPLDEVGNTPQQEAATTEQGPTVQGAAVQESGAPTTEQNIEDTSPVDEWMNRAREMEAAAERIRKDPKTGEVGQKRSQELRKDANDLRAKALSMMAENRRDEELGLKQKRLEAQLTRNAATQAPLSKEAVDFAVGQYLDGNSSAVTGLARNQTAQAQIKNRIPQMAAERGMKPADVNASQQRFHGLMQEQRSLGTRAANVALPINELKTFIPLAEKASDAVARTNFVPINRVLQMSRNQWSPEQAAFVAANRSIINAFAQLASRGVPTVHNTQEAETMLNTAQTPAQYKAVLQQLWREAEAARRAVTMSREDARKEATGQDVPEQPYPGNYGKTKTPPMGTKSKPSELLKPYSDPEEEKAYQEYKRKQGGG